MSRSIASRQPRSAQGSDMKYRVLISQDENGVFVAEVPNLPGCVSQGDTREAAVANVREAIQAHRPSPRRSSRSEGGAAPGRLRASGGASVYQDRI